MFQLLIGSVTQVLGHETPFVLYLPNIPYELVVEDSYGTPADDTGEVRVLPTSYTSRATRSVLNQGRSEA